MTKLLSVLVVLSLVIAVMAIELVLIHWAVGLFYPITWTQAFVYRYLYRYWELLSGVEIDLNDLLNFL